MTRRADYPWGRWVRVSEAHYYACGGDRRYFDKYFKPHLTSIQLSKQGRAYMRAEIDAVAENIELEFATGGPATRKEIATHGSNENERHHYRCRRQQNRQ